MTSPTVSIVIPTYNRSSTLQQAIESALDQTYRAVEVIVVDDGSTDETESVLAMFPGRIRIVRQANRGRSAARNVGVAIASGAYVVFLDSDDLLLPDKLRTQVSFLERHPEVDVVFGNGFTLSEGGHLGPLEPFVVPLPVLDRSDFAARLILDNLFAIHAALIRTTALQLPRPFDEALHAFEDWDLWIRMAARGACFRYQDEKVAIYRRHPGNTEVGDSRVFTDARTAICAKVVRSHLDEWLPAYARQQHRLRHFGAILRTRSPRIIASSVRTIINPDGKLSPRGILLILGACVGLALRSLSRRLGIQVRCREQPREPATATGTERGG